MNLSKQTNQGFVHHISLHIFAGNYDLRYKYLSFERDEEGTGPALPAIILRKAGDTVMLLKVFRTLQDSQLHHLVTK